MSDPQFLRQPLLPSAAAGPVSGATRTIIFRLLAVLLVALVSIFANHEASKGFHLTIINAAGDTPSGRRFDLLFVSNDKISRLLLRANDVAQTILSHEQEYKNSIRSVTVHFTGEKLAVHSEDGRDFVISIRSSVLEERDADLVMVRAVARTMTRIWLWNIRHDKNSSCLIDAIAESIAMFSDFHPGDNNNNDDEELLLLSPGCSNKNVRKVAEMLHYCERKMKGLIGRLVQVLSETVEDPTVHKFGQVARGSLNTCEILSSNLGPY